FTTDATVEERDAEGGRVKDAAKLLYCKRPQISQQTLGKASSHHCPWHKKTTTTMLQLRPQRMRNGKDGGGFNVKEMKRVILVFRKYKIGDPESTV
uniref:HTH_48 domain-containing protein n=1 Tax=Globodera pallida TaxID=36090 RepID=A0A183CPH4_GLOPA